MFRMVKGIPLAVFFIIYTVTICLAGGAELLPGEITTAENKCRLFLRTLGASQNAYSKSNSYGNYGTWYDLKRSGYIPENRTRSDYIENYSIMLFDTNRATMTGNESAYDSSFTIIAMPTKYKHQLRPFGINEHRIPYVWTTGYSIPPHMIKLGDPNYWRPIQSHKQIRLDKRMEMYRDTMENRCKLTLRALGSTQLAYADANRDNNYGSWWALTESDYIQEGYTRANIIENYSICVFFVRNSSKNPQGMSNHDSRFAIVTVPRSQKHGLRTFGLGDDQTPRMWVGRTSNFELMIQNPGFQMFRFDNPNMWEPIR